MCVLVSLEATHFLLAEGVALPLFTEHVVGSANHFLNKLK